ncbi:MAG: hypothetical protein ACLFP8_01030 [Alphaproteobacteria bacterium]
MTILSSFTSEEAELIISLPYRVGMHVSYSEDEDGERDDELEMKALKTALREEAQAEDGNSVVQEIAGATLESEDKWEAWGQGVFNIEPLCERAVATLRTQASTEDVKAYVKMCLNVASSVARAYGEFGEDGAAQDNSGSGIFGRIMGEISKAVSGGGADAHHPMNVSAAEDSAIERIAQAMKRALSE